MQSLQTGPLPSKDVPHRLYALRGSSLRQSRQTFIPAAAWRCRPSQGGRITPGISGVALPDLARGNKCFESLLSHWLNVSTSTPRTVALLAYCL